MNVISFVLYNTKTDKKKWDFDLNLNKLVERMVATCQVVLMKKMKILKVYDYNNDKQRTHFNQASLKVCITMQNRKTHIHTLTQPERRE